MSMDIKIKKTHGHSSYQIKNSQSQIIDQSEQIKKNALNILMCNSIW